jgi:DNA-binding response OmpR family regulator
MNVDSVIEDQKRDVILIVDDIPLNLKILEAILVKEEYEIVRAVDGRQALNRARDILPDLILLDIMMPKMDGFQACKALKRSSKTKHIPIIFLTSKSGTESVVRGLKLGAADYVVKPFKAAELIARVRTHLELKKARDNQAILISKLQKALEDVKQLSGLLPICAHCKKVRNDEGYWQQVEVYITNHSTAQFTHGICPECLEQYYHEYAD